MDASQNILAARAGRKRFLQQAKKLMSFIDEKGVLPSPAEEKPLYTWLFTQLADRRIRFIPPKSTALIEAAKPNLTPKEALWYNKAALLKEWIQREHKLPTHSQEKTLIAWLNAQKKALSLQLPMSPDQKAVLHSLMTVMNTYHIPALNPFQVSLSAGIEQYELEKDDRFMRTEPDISNELSEMSGNNSQVLNTMWLQSFTRLSRFININKRWPYQGAPDTEEGMLVAWCRDMRLRYKNFEISTLYIELLESIDFPFETK